MDGNDVLKALASCVDSSTCGDCEYGKSRTENRLCVDLLHKDAAKLIRQRNAELEMINAQLEEYKAWYFSTVTELEKMRKQNEILVKNADTAFQDGLNEAQELYAEQIRQEIEAEIERRICELERLGN